MKQRLNEMWSTLNTAGSAVIAAVLAVVLAFLLAAALTLLTSAAEADAATLNNSANAKKNDAAKGRKSAGALSTDVRFDDQLVGGKYHYPDEAVATVEDEKVLNDLLGARKDFKDRMRAEADRDAR
jgi:hypothetical protein